MVAITNIDAIKQIIEACSTGAIDYQSTELALSNILNAIDQETLNTENIEETFYNLLINGFVAIENPSLKGYPNLHLHLHLQPNIQHYFNQKLHQRETLFCDIELAKSKVLFVENAIKLYEKFGICDFTKFIKSIIQNDFKLDVENNLKNLPGYEELQNYIDSGLQSDYDDYLWEEYGIENFEDFEDEDEDEDDDDDDGPRYGFRLSPVDFTTYRDDNLEDFLDSVSQRLDFTILTITYMSHVYPYLVSAA